MVAVDPVSRGKVKTSVSRSIPKLPGKALVKHRYDHEKEHLFMMNWIQLRPFLGYKKVSLCLYCFCVLLLRAAGRRQLKDAVRSVISICIGRVGTVGSICMLMRRLDDKSGFVGYERLVVK